MPAIDHIRILTTDQEDQAADYVDYKNSNEELKEDSVISMKNTATNQE